jgi:tRNA (adenine57-N1/adenine58-N1)-methyltransferase
MNNVVLKRKHLIKAGEVVCAYISRDNLQLVLITPGQYLNSKFGNFKHDSLIGLEYGSKLYSADRKSGWIVLLPLTAALWTQACPHRTEILYAHDIATIVTAGLDLRPGAWVLESGTGSGSLTVSLSRAVSPTGHVVTFEYHRERAHNITEQLKRLARGGLDYTGHIHVVHGDVVARGFTVQLSGTNTNSAATANPSTAEHNTAVTDATLLHTALTQEQRSVKQASEHVTGVRADAVFLDLPSPWLVIESVKQSLNVNGRVVSFSPCIEQVQKTSQALLAAHFEDVVTVECLFRDYEVKTMHQGSAHPRGQKRKREETADTATSTDTGASNNAAPSLTAAAPAPTSTAIITTRPFPEMRGHTGYLTFARRVRTV